MKTIRKIASYILAFASVLAICTTAYAANETNGYSAEDLLNWNGTRVASETTGIYTVSGENFNIQIMLNRCLDDFMVACDGFYSDHLTTAIRYFQIKYNLETTGIMDEATIECLNKEYKERCSVRKVRAIEHCIMGTCPYFEDMETCAEVQSGEVLNYIEIDETGGYVKVSKDDGTEGWLPQYYLTGHFIYLIEATQELFVYMETKEILYTEVITGNVSANPSENHPTPKGDFEIQEIEYNTYLQGNKHVDIFIVFYVQGHTKIGFHDAYWKHKFGADIFRCGGGSLGCVNTPEAEVEFLSTLATIGTKVTVV